MKVALALVLVAVSCSLDPVSSRVVDGNPKESLKSLLQLLNTTFKEILEKLEELGSALMVKDPVEAQKNSIPIFQKVKVLIVSCQYFIIISERFTVPECQLME
ncbi:uncharacterized protein LOC144766952 [Lissotriton helveticus]